LICEKLNPDRFKLLTGWTWTAGGVTGATAGTCTGFGVGDGAGFIGGSVLVTITREGVGEACAKPFVSTRPIIKAADKIRVEVKLNFIDIRIGRAA